MWKYVDIVVDVLIFKDTLFSWYIFLYFMVCASLRSWTNFFYACGPFNVCGTNNGSYIPLSQKPNKWAIIVHAYNYYKQKSCN